MTAPKTGSKDGPEDGNKVGNKVGSDSSPGSVASKGAASKGSASKGATGKSAAKAPQDAETARPAPAAPAAPAGEANAAGGGAKDRAAPVSIKKYANRRLYNTGTSTYVTLDDLSRMVRRGEDFAVTDARTGEDITRSVLAQIIFEQESKGQTDGPNLLPLSVMRQLIRFYGDSMQSMVPKYLEYSMDALDRDQEKFRHLSETMTRSLGAGPLGAGAMGAKALGTGTLAAIEERTRRNMETFTRAMQLFNPFAALQEQARPAAEAPEEAAPVPEPPEDDLTALKRQMREMQERLERLSKD